jgi:predicted RNase H-like HicB family nuclease
MAQRFYPAVLERGPKLTFAVWFPDFPGVVAAARTQEEAMSKARDALAQGARELYEANRVMPEPTPFEKIKVPKDCQLVTHFAVGAEPPDPSERVNIYLPKSLLERIDRRAAELGMSRSSFFGFAANWALGAFAPSFGARPILPAPLGRALGRPIVVKDWERHKGRQKKRKT